MKRRIQIFTLYVTNGQCESEKTAELSDKINEWLDHHPEFQVDRIDTVTTSSSGVGHDNFFLTVTVQYLVGDNSNN